MEFMTCKKCGNVITFAGPCKCKGLTCCGEPMAELKANTVDAAHEKHVPVVSTSGANVTVSVGSVAHPMQDAHFIGVVAIETNKGCQIKALKPAEEPKAEFALTDGESVTAAYAYCNLHGLWTAAAD